MEPYLIIFSPVDAKVACTNWKRVLMVLMGKTNATDPLDVDRTQAHHYKVFRRLNSYTRSEAEFMLSNYTKFLFVRHPLERLLSAYRNKFVENLAINARFHTIYGSVLQIPGQVKNNLCVMS